MERLDAVGIRYVPVNVTASERARQSLRELCKSPLGIGGRMSTPTTLVGRQVIHGADIEAIRRALADERKRPLR